MHHPHPSHFSSSTIIRLPLSDCLNASREQASTHGGSLQNLQVKAVLSIGVRRITLILDNAGLGKPFFSNEQTYSHNPHPEHLSGLTETNCLVLILDFSKSFIMLSPLSNLLFECCISKCWLLLKNFSKRSCSLLA